MEALKALPSHYELHGTLDISKNKLMAAGMNVAAAAAFFPFGWMAWQFLRIARPDAGFVVTWLNGSIEIVDAVAGDFMMVA